MDDKVVAVVGARLNSSRLPKKHFLPLAGKPLIDRLWSRLEKVTALSDIVLATTDDDYNIPLCDWARKSHRKYLAYSSDVNDLVGRVDEVVKHYDADIILYVCGDCPLIEPSTIDRMLLTIVGHPSVDTVSLNCASDGRKAIHEGFDVYRRNFWDRMVAVAQKPFEREHVGAVYHHLKKVAPNIIAAVDEPKQYFDIGHRISVDTPSDYRFMRRVYRDWYAQNNEETIVDLSSVIQRLKREPSLAKVNGHVHQKSIKDLTVKVVIVTEVGPDVGMGHLVRMLVAAFSLQDYLGANVKLIICGKHIDLPDLALVSHEWVKGIDAMQWGDLASQNDLMILDVKDPRRYIEYHQDVRAKRSVLVGVDVSENEAPLCDFVWIPSFYCETARYETTNMHFGWDCFLLREGPSWQARKHSKYKKMLVLSGGSDAAELGDFLPSLLLDNLPENTLIDWVQGPYAKPPKNINLKPDRFSILFAPENIPELLVHYDVVLCVYGVSYFECLRAGIPTIVLDAVGVAQKEEWKLLKQTFPGYVADNYVDAVEKLKLLVGGSKHKGFASMASSKLRQGSQSFGKAIGNLLVSN